MRARLLTAALLVTLPAWFVPALVWCGWQEAGRDLIVSLPEAVRFVFTGRDR